MFDQLLKILKVGGIISSDLIVLVTVFVVLCIYALYFGKEKIISLLISFYPATLLYKNIPFLDKLIILSGDVPILLNKLVIFLLVLVLMNIIIARYIYTEEYGGSKNYLRVFGYALAGTILFLVFCYTVISLNLFHDFSPFVDKLFVGEIKVFGWLVAPLIILLFL